MIFSYVHTHTIPGPIYKFKKTANLFSIKARCHFDKVFDETLIVTTVKEIFDQKL
jgi:hypothetical protein